MARAICPKCEKDDQIQNVTSIFSGGISTTSYEVYGGSTKTAFSQTQLAKRISPPPKPKGSMDEWSTCLTMFLFIIGGAIVGGIFQAISGLDLFKNGIPFVVGFFIPEIGLIWLRLYLSKKVKKTIPDWERKIAAWSEFYYCYRDDCVFDPKTNKYTSPEGMSSLY